MAATAALPTAANEGNTGVYWIGSNGQIYTNVAGVSGGVHDQGAADVSQSGPEGYAINTPTGPSYTTGITEIADPNAPAQTPAVTGSSGSSTPAGGTLSQSVIDAVMQSIANDVSQNQGTYNTALSTNQQNQANGDAQYGVDNTNNTEGRAQSIQQAETAGATGLSGLDAVLASLGALNGTGSLLAGRAVANTTNNDIGSANQTFNTNKTAIGNAQAGYDTDYNQNNANLATALQNDNKGAQATGYQDLLDQADSIGDTSLYNKYLPLAVGATTPTQSIAPTVIPVSQATTASYGANSPLTVGMTGNNTSSPQAPAAGITPTNSSLAITKDNS